MFLALFFGLVAASVFGHFLSRNLREQEKASKLVVDQTKIETRILEKKERKSQTNYRKYESIVKDARRNNSKLESDLRRMQQKLIDAEMDEAKLDDILEQNGYDPNSL